MLRDTLNANSKMAALTVNGSGAWRWQRRTTTGGLLSTTNSSSGTAVSPRGAVPGNRSRPESGAGVLLASGINKSRSFVPVHVIQRPVPSAISAKGPPSSGRRATVLSWPVGEIW